MFFFFFSKHQDRVCLSSCVCVQVAYCCSVKAFISISREDSLIMLLKWYWNTDGRTILPIFHFKSCIL